MADRSVKVRLQAEVAGFIAGVQKARAEVKTFSGELKQDAGKHQQAWTDVGVGLTAVGVAATGAFVAAEAAAMGFDKTMSNVKAATQANGQSFDLLRQAAIQAGKDTAFSASQAAEAETELAKAGVSVKDILGGGLKGALSLAAAGQISVADAASYASTAMTQFGLSGKDVPHIADLLAAAANKAQGEVSDFATAMKYVGPVAHQMGISIEETSGTLALLASNGILADQAGTSLRGMLTALTSPSAQAADEMQKLGINVYDANGKFVGFRGVAQQLHDTMGNLDNATRDQALGQIFGNEQITTARVLYASGGEAVDKWTKSVDASGYAGEVAATKMDNLAGDLEQLKGSLETALIESGSKGTGALRALTQGATTAVNAFIALPGPLQGLALGISGLGGAASLAAGGFFLAVPKIAAFKESLAGMGPTAQRFSSALGGAGRFLMGPWGLAIGAGVAALGYFAVKHAEAKQRVDDLTEALRADSGALGDNTRQATVNQLSKDGVLKAAQSLGINLQTVTDAALGNADAMAQVNGRLKDITDSYAAVDASGAVFMDSADDTGTAMHTVAEAISGQNSALKDAKEQYQRTAEAMGDTGKAADGTAPAVDALSTSLSNTDSSAKDAKQALSDFKSAIDDLTQPTFDIRSAQRSWQKAIDDTTASLKDNGKHLDISSEKGRANQQALDDLAQAANGVTTAMYENGSTQEQLQKQVDTSRARFETFAEKMGMSKDKAHALADQLINMPLEVKPKVDDKSIAAAGSTAQGVLNKLHAIDGYTATATVDIAVHQGALNKLHAMGATFAVGGYVSGPGTGTSDSISARLSNGEYVVNAATVSRLGRSFFDAINGGGTVAATGAASVAPMQSGSPDVVAAIGRLESRLVSLERTTAAAPSQTSRAVTQMIRQGV